MINIDKSWKQTFIKFIFEESLLDFIAFNKAIALKNMNIPKRLFKYRKPNENTLKALHDLSGWFSPCSDQNDTFEAISRIDYQEVVGKNDLEEINKRVPNLTIKISEQVMNDSSLLRIKESFDEIIQKSKNKTDEVKYNDEVNSKFKRFLELVQKYKTAQSEILPQKLRNRFSIYSLSEYNLSPQMWSYYSDDSKGVCIEYDFTELDNENYIKNHLFPVIYSDELVDITPYLTIAAHDNQYFENPVFLILPVLNKTTSWAHEAEWRIIKDDNFENSGMAVILPKPKTVFLGLKIEEEFKLKVVDVCNKQGIQIRQLKVNMSSRMLEED